MHLKQSITYWSGLLCLGILSITTGSCRRDHEGVMEKHTITIENILDSKPLVESGTFKGAGNPPVIMPGQSVTIRFAAGKGQAISFAAMYGWSNDLFLPQRTPVFSYMVLMVSLWKAMCPVKLDYGTMAHVSIKNPE